MEDTAANSPTRGYIMSPEAIVILILFVVSIVRESIIYIRSPLENQTHRRVVACWVVVISFMVCVLAALCIQFTDYAFDVVWEDNDYYSEPTITETD